MYYCLKMLKPYSFTDELVSKLDQRAEEGVSRLWQLPLVMTTSNPTSSSAHRSMHIIPFSIKADMHHAITLTDLVPNQICFQFCWLFLTLEFDFSYFVSFVL